MSQDNDEVEVSLRNLLFTIAADVQAIRRALERISPPETAVKLPEDFPGREALIEAGYIDTKQLPLTSRQLRQALPDMDDKTRTGIMRRLNRGRETAA